MRSSDASALRGGVSRPSRKACSRTVAPRLAAKSSMAAMCASWLWTPPGESRPSTCSVVPALASTAARSTGLAANSPLAMALSMRVKS